MQLMIGSIKGRHSGENRSPGNLKLFKSTGFRLEFTPHLIRGRNETINNGVFHYSNTPALQFSSSAILQYSIF